MFFVLQQLLDLDVLDEARISAATAYWRFGHLFLDYGLQVVTLWARMCVLLLGLANIGLEMWCGSLLLLVHVQGNLKHSYCLVQLVIFIRYLTCVFSNGILVTGTGVVCERICRSSVLASNMFNSQLVYLVRLRIDLDI